MVDMSATSAQVVCLPRAEHQGFADRVAFWILARSERRRIEQLERLGWDLEAGCDRRGDAGAERIHHVVLPPGGGLF